MAFPGAPLEPAPEPGNPSVSSRGTKATTPPLLTRPCVPPPHPLPRTEPGGSRDAKLPRPMRDPLALPVTGKAPDPGSDPAVWPWTNDWLLCLSFLLCEWGTSDATTW